MAVISDNLIHFLGRNAKDSPQRQLKVFKSIIENGLQSSKINIKFSEGGAISNQVVCFTDIPLSECHEHTAIYGKFGIGFKKAFVKNRGGNPARYFVDYLPGETLDSTIVENRGALYLNLCSHFKIILALQNRLKADPNFKIIDQNGVELIEKEVLKQWVQEQIAIFSFDKEMGDLGPARDETKEIDLYYKEREWRLVPSQLNIMSGTARLNESTSHFIYPFSRSDVNVVVTPNDEIRAEIIRYFMSFDTSPDPRLKEFAVNPLPVVSFDDLQKW